MKVISFSHGKKNWRFVVPASRSPTGKTRAYYFATRAEAEKKLFEFRRFGAAALVDLQMLLQPIETQPAAVRALQNSQRWQCLVERFGLTPKQINKALAREAGISKES